MAISSVHNYPLLNPASYPHRSANPVKETVPPVRTVLMAYDTSIGRAVAQIVAESEVVRQNPTPEAISFVRSFKAVILSLLGKVI